MPRRKIVQMDRFAVRSALGALALMFVTTGAGANPASAALRARGTAELYNLDREQAAATFRAAIAADPQDGAAYRGLASVLWIGIAFDRGTMTVDSYLGRVTRDNVKLPPPPPAVSAAFHQAIDQALKLARAKVDSHPKDAEAHYELGAAIGLRASYMATIDGGILGAFRAAREAYDAHETVLRLAPTRHDAGLIVGTYRYLVAALSMPLRWVAYAAGFGGGRDKGLQLIANAAEYPGDNQADARLALVLLYNREQRFDAAMRQLEKLRARYPGNRLLWLEAGATEARAGRHAEAERLFDEGISRTLTDSRPRMFGEEALWYYKRGTARAHLGRIADAQRDLTTALARDGRPWVHGRAHFELGKLELKGGRETAAVEHLRTAIRLCESDRDGATADEAKALLK
jgi:tetratricopeptide (TPR) repeat protein